VHAPPQIVQLLEEFSRQVAVRDLDGSIELFDLTAEVVIVGSEEGYGAKGSDDVRAFFERLYSRDVTFSWDWSEIKGGQSDAVSWGFAEGHEIVKRQEDSKHVPYRMSIVAREIDKRWRIVLLHGSEPVPD
jgi:hypothetical protein